jgi:phage tail-like protein
MAVAERVDPYAQFNFTIEVEGQERGGFTEVGGLTAESDVFEYREGRDKPATMRKLPGLLKFPNITCKRGYTQDLYFWEWRRTSLIGQTSRRDGAIILYDEQHVAVLRWQFTAGWIFKYDGPALNSKTNEAAIESLEITHEGLFLAKA